MKRNVRKIFFLKRTHLNLGDFEVYEPISFQLEVKDFLICFPLFVLFHFRLFFVNLQCLLIWMEVSVPSSRKSRTLSSICRTQSRTFLQNPQDFNVPQQIVDNTQTHLWLYGMDSWDEFFCSNKCLIPRSPIFNVFLSSDKKMFELYCEILKTYMKIIS